MNGDSYSSSRGGDRYGHSRDYHSSSRSFARPPRGADADGAASQGSDYRRDRDRGERDRRRDRERSRSPHARHTRRDDHYSRGREHGGGGDRDMERDRYRDREERFGGRRGGDRDFDREAERERRRGGRDRREPREFEAGGRRGGRAGGGAADDALFAQNRRRSATPPPKKREPTPDLTNTEPITERKRRMTMWDIKPQGYENVTAEQAKLSGMFPLPGAPRQAPMDPTRLHAFMTQPQSVATSQTLKPTNSRQSKRLYVQNIPENADEEALQQHFNSILSPLNVTTGNPEPVMNVQLNPNKALAMLEFKNTNDTTVCLAFNGTSFQGHKLAIRRPKDYIVPLLEEQLPTEEAAGSISSNVPDTPNKILVSKIPDYLGDEQVIELLKSFGELKAFVLVKDSTDDSSKGIAFCEYLEPATTDIAVEGLHDMELGDAKISVQRASIGMKQAAGVEMGVNAMAMMAGTTSADLEASRVVQLLNMVTAEELMDNDEYNEICDDIREECSKFGKLVDMKVPRPSGGSRQAVGVGKIFVRFESQQSADTALKTLAGRKFADRTVVCTYFSEENYEVAAF